MLDRVVFFNDGWVPYEERGAWLLDADCAISTHRDHLETRFAFRTRLLDCFWAGLPVVCTAGDDLADRVERDGLGAAVPPGDAERRRRGARARARPRPRRLRAARSRRRGGIAWPRVAEPLVALVASARRPAAARARAGRARPPARATVRARRLRAGGSAPARAARGRRR